MTKDAIRVELERLQATAGGVLKPAEVVEAARSVTSPLHSQFDWDDAEAGEKWRIEQARRLIRVHVIVEGTNVEPIRAFVALRTDRKTGGGYRLTVDVLDDVARRAQLLADARSELAAFRRKYTTLSQYADVWAAADAMDRALAAAQPTAQAVSGAA